MTAQTRSRFGRRLAWLAVIALASMALLVPPTLAAGPGNNGNGYPNGGPKSDSSVDENPALVAGGATMNSASVSCDGSTAASFAGSFNLTEEFDEGSTIVVYLAPNNGSNANPIANVDKNYKVVNVELVGKYNFTIPVTFPFTATNGGILIVFAVNQNGTVISSSKSNSLNCTESTATGTPTDTPTGTPTDAPTGTPTDAPTGTPTEAPTDTPTDVPPTGDVGGATGTPGGGAGGATSDPTLPTTSTIDGANGPLNDGWRVILLGLAAILAVALLLTPATAVVRKDDASR